MTDLEGMKARFQPPTSAVLPGADFADRLARDLATGDHIETDTPDTYGKPAAPQPATLVPLPAGIVHSPDATQIGQLSAEAITSEYETAARGIEAMAAALVQMAKDCDADALAAVKRNAEVKAIITDAVTECQQAAAHFRQSAADIFGRIEKASTITADVRRKVAEMCENISFRTP